MRFNFFKTLSCLHLTCDLKLLFSHIFNNTAEEQVLLLINEWNCIKTRHRLFANDLMRTSSFSLIYKLENLITLSLIICTCSVFKNFLTILAFASHLNERLKKSVNGKILFGSYLYEGFSTCVRQSSRKLKSFLKNSSTLQIYDDIQRGY